MNERRQAGRRKSFLRGLVYFDSKQGALSCLVRDLSDDGARIVFSEGVAVPESFDLHIVQRNRTQRAHVTWRRGCEIGLAFDAAAAKSDPAALTRRVAELEGEIATLREMFKTTKDDGEPPLDDEAAA
jgi:hypothetical protein